MNCIENRRQAPIRYAQSRAETRDGSDDSGSIEAAWRQWSAAGETKGEILNRRFGKTAVAAIVTGALWFFAAAPRAHADDDRSRCQHAVEKAESRLDRTIEKHGEHSHEAEERRRDLNAERERCWNQYHQWWNARDHRWETEHNWDQDHHDHDDHDRH
jgi:hypothetical protein